MSPVGDPTDDPRFDEARHDDPRSSALHSARPPRRRRRNSRRLQITVGLLILLAVLVAVVPHHSGVSRALPAGGWGATLRCLEHDPLNRVQDTATRALPDARTTSALVSRIHGTSLAELRLADSAAAARAIAPPGRQTGGLTTIDPTAARIDGRVVWAYALGGDPPHRSASTGDRTLIDFCVRMPGRR